VLKRSLRINIPSYPKVLTLGNSQIYDIFEESVTVEEKIDGSQFSFANLEGEFVTRSKGAHMDVPNPMFKLGIDYALSLYEKGLIKEGTVVRCEFLQKPKHNVLAYARVPRHNIIVLDVEHNLKPIDYDEKVDFANLLDLETSPLLFSGKVDDPKQLDVLLETMSILGNVTIEGYVIKNYLRRKRDDKYFLGKVVSTKFKEKHEHDWKKPKRTINDVIDQLNEQFKTEARWMKAIQHLRDDGKLLYELKDIGNLIPEILRDLEEEEEDYIKKCLYDFVIKNIGHSITRGFPEFYKEYLIQEMLEKRRDISDANVDDESENNV